MSKDWPRSEKRQISSFHPLSLSSGSFALLLTSFVLRELPAIGLHKELGAIFARLLIIPHVLAKSPFDEDLLAFADQFGKIFGARTPDLNVDKRRYFLFQVVDNRHNFIDAQRNICHRSALGRVANFR